MVCKAGISDTVRERRTCLTHDECYVDVEIDGDEQAKKQLGSDLWPRAASP